MAMSLRVASLAFACAAVVAASAAHADGDKALGQFLSSECVTCHQITGRYEGIPPIVGGRSPSSSKSWASTAPRSEPIPSCKRLRFG